MNPQRFLFPAFAILVLFIGYRGANAFMIAKAIAPPSASTISILRLAIHPPFSMASPYRGLFTTIKMKLHLIPSVEACGSLPACDGTKAEANCGDCQSPYCYCPGCDAYGPCTPYYCVQTNGNTLCQASVNVNPNDQCYTCETDSNVKCLSLY